MRPLFPRGLTSRLIANRELCDNIYSSPRSARIDARVCAFFRPRGAQSRSDTSRYVPTAVHRFFVGLWRGPEPGGGGKVQGSEGDEKKASGVRGHQRHP